MPERRRDPRTDPQFSLRNLLRVRSLREDYDLAVLSTSDGVLMAGSREDRAARRAAAHTAQDLSARATRIEREGRTTRAQLSAMRFETRGQPLCLTVVGRRRIPAESLQSMAERVCSILLEHHLRRRAVARPA